MQHRFLLTCTLLAFLNACVPATATPSTIPTFTPTLPATSLPSALPSDAATVRPTIGVVSPTPEETSTPATTPSLESTPAPLPTLDVPPTLEATSIPQPAAGSAAIQFYGPGPLSKLVSSVAVYGYAIPGYGNKGRVYLYGEDGRVLASEVLQLNTAYTWAYYYWTLHFEIQAAGELARLTMSTQDQYGRLTAVNSVHLILLAEGFSVVNQPGDLRERCVIDLPAPGRRISGGILAVSGEMRPFNILPLVVELIDRDGNVLAVQLVATSPVPDDSYVPFQVDLPYSISSGTWARLVVRQPDELINGTMYLYSREVFLNP